MSVLEMSSRHSMVRRGEKSAVAAVCYITASQGYDERTGQSFDYSVKGRVDGVEVILPEGMPSWMSDPVKLMAAAELYEDAWAERRYRTPMFQERHKASAVIARQAYYSLHNSFKDDPEKVREMIRTFVQERYTAYGVGVVVAIHDEPNNLHFHVQATQRVVEDSLEGFGRRASCFASPAIMSAWAKENRSALARLQNEALKERGIEGVVEHRSFVERDLELDATLHHGELGEALMERGEQPRVFLENQKIEAQNADRVIQDPEIILKYLNASQATFTGGNIRYEVMRRVGGDEALVEHVFKAVMQHEELVALPQKGDEEARYTTKTYQAHEQEMFDAASRMYHSEVFLNPWAPLDVSGLNEGQEDAAYALASKSRLVLLRGAAGVGKTTLLRPVARYFEDQGYRVRGLALAGVAVEGLKSSLGCEARTIASFLKREEMKAQGKVQSSSYDLGPRDVVIVDEAGMVDVPTLSKVLSLIEQSGAMVRLVGDPEQLKAIGAGDAFRGLLERFHSVTVDEVVRQKGTEDREAVKLMSRGFMDQGLGLLKDRMQWYDTSDEVMKAMVDAFVADAQASWASPQENDKGCIMLAFLRRDVAALNAQAREALRTVGLIQHEREVSQDKRRLGIGDRIIFLEKNKDLKVVNGTRGTVCGFNEEGSVLVQTTDHHTLTFNPEAFRAWDYAYALTVHKSQGVTVRKALMKADKMLGSEGHYVGLSRHEKDVTLMISRDVFSDESALIQALERGGRKDVLQDHVPSTEADHFLEEALSRYRGLRSEVLSLKGGEQDTHQMRSEIREIAETLVRQWGQGGVSSKARLSGLSLRTLEQDAGIRERPLSSRECVAQERIHAYQEASQDAGDLWKMIRKTHPGAQCWSHPDYHVFQEVRMKRDALASEIVSQMNDHRDLMRMERISRKVLETQARAHQQREKVMHKTLNVTDEHLSISQNQALKNQDVERQNKRLNALALSFKAQPIQGTLAERYLREHRHIETASLPEASFKFLPKGSTLPSGHLTRHPGLMVMGYEAPGVLGCVQVISLDEETAAKARLNVVKMTHGALLGSYVEIQAGTKEEPVILAEGVETALSLKEAGLQGSIYSVLGIQNLKTAASFLEAHYGEEHQKTIILAADQDGQESAPSHKTVHDVAQDLLEKGYKVSIARPESTPDQPKKDWNDVLKEYGVQGLREAFQGTLTPVQKREKVQGEVSIKEVLEQSSQGASRESSEVDRASQEKRSERFRGQGRYNLVALNDRLRERVRDVLPQMVSAPLARKESTRTHLIFKDASQKISFCIEGTKSGLWYDFKRGKGGNFVDLIQDQHHLTKGEAIEKLAQMVGLEPEHSPEIKRGRESSQHKPHKLTLREALGVNIEHHKIDHKVRDAYRAQMPVRAHKREAQETLSRMEEKTFCRYIFENMKEYGEKFSEGHVLASLQVARVQARLSLEAVLENKPLSSQEAKKRAMIEVKATQVHVPEFQKALEAQGWSVEMVQDRKHALLGHIQRYGRPPDNTQKEHIMRVVKELQPLKGHMEVPKELSGMREVVWHHCVDRVLLNMRDGRPVTEESLKKGVSFVSRQLQSNMRVMQRHLEKEKWTQVQNQHIPGRDRSKGLEL